MEPLETTLPPASPPAGRPFSAGDVIGRSFSVWFRSFVPFSVVTLAVNVPVLLLVALAPEEGGSGVESAANLVSVFTNLVVTGALTYGVLQGLKGAPAPLGALFRTGFAKLGKVLLVSFGFGVIVLVGLVLLVVPGIVAICALYVAIPAAVVEPITPSEALGRSRTLTKGSRWGILAVALVVFVATIAIVTAATAVALLAAGALPHPIPILVATAVTVLAAPLGACASAVAYHDLRVAKEGVDTATLVKVFE